MRTRALALLGLALLVPVALALVRGSITIVQAAERGVLLVVGLAVVERVLLPVGQLFLTPTRRHDDR